jgi:hypothetical protein
MLGVLLCGLVAVMGRMQAMCMRDMGMMTCLFMMAGFVVFRSLAMMVRRVLVMLGRGLMMAAGFVFARGHVALSLGSRVPTNVRLLSESDTRMNGTIKYGDWEG